jgi:hypothetical protein
MAVQFGDTSGALKGKQIGGNQNLVGAPNQENLTVGDASELRGNATGGDDSLSGGFSSHGEHIVGDAFRASGNAVCGNDSIRGAILGSFEWLYGDVSEDLRGNATGGNDFISGGRESSVHAFGDAYRAWDNVTCGDDVITGAAFALNGFIYGDALELHGNAAGGNDILVGGILTFNYLYGDAQTLTDSASGGDDRLIGGAWIDWMWGDAQTVSELASTGNDTFVFRALDFIGNDVIFDFRPGEDTIELSGFAAHSFEDLSIGQVDFDHDGTLDSSIIQFGIFSSITVVGLTQLTTDDFLFV